MAQSHDKQSRQPSAEQMLALAERIQREVHEDGVKLDLVRRASMRWTSDEYDLARALLARSHVVPTAHGSAAVTPDVAAHVGHVPSVERVKQAHSYVGQDWFKPLDGVGHHVKYAQGDDGCYLCALLIEIERLKASAPSATERSTDDENNTHWGFMFPDGSVWTDDLFPFKDAAERFLNTPDAQFVEGAKLVELVIRRADGGAK